MADYLGNERHFSQMVTVAVNTQAAAEGISRLIEVVGEDRVAASLTHRADADDFTGDARTILRADADAVFVWALDAQAALLLQALRDLGWNGLVAYTGLDDDFIAQAGASLTAGVIGPAAWSSVAYDTDSRAFVTAYQAQWGETPSAYAAACYDALYLLAEAVRAEGSDVSAIATALETMTGYDGVQGVYDSAHTDGLRLLEATEDGGLVELAHYDAGTCITCPAIWYPDITDENVDEEGIFTVALIATLEGSAEVNGRHAEQAARLAVREINAVGGVIGADGVRYTLRLSTYSATSAAEASEVFSQAVADGAQVILGPDFNALVLPNLSLAAAAGVPQLVSATSSQVHTDGGGYVFPIRASDLTLASAAATYLLEERGLTDLVAVAVRTDYGLDAAEAIEDAVDSSDDGRLLSLVHEVDEEDFAEMAARIVRAEAQAVLAWTTPPAATRLLDELGALGWNSVFVYGYLTPEVLATLTVPAGIELLGAVNWWAVAEDGTSVDFAARYADTYGELPRTQSAAYYDAVHLIAHGLQAVGADANDMQGWLASETGFVGAQGVYQANGSGEMTDAVLIVGVDNESVYEVFRYGIAAVLSATSATSLASASESAATTDTCTITTAYSINLRAEPTVDADALLVVPYETALTPTGVTEDGWYQVTYADVSGYVFGENVLTDSCDELATVSISTLRIIEPVSGASFAGDGGTARVQWETVPGTAVYRADRPTVFTNKV